MRKKLTEEERKNHIAKSKAKYYQKNKLKPEVQEHYTDYNRNHHQMFAYVIPEEKELIENYELAKADNFKGWHLHHRNELDGHRIINHKQLKAEGRYYNRPASELIFLTRSDHKRIHNLKEKLFHKPAMNATLLSLKSEIFNTLYEFLF